MAALTIGMATYDDFDGVWFTVQALRLYQDLDDVELLVVDNFGCETTRDYLQTWTDVRYLRATDVSGTAAPRDLVFREATGDAVLCIDSHVLLAPGVVARLKEYYRAHPTTRDLLQGPLLADDLTTVWTHFDPVWRAQMWGTWATDPRGLDPEGEAFDIPMQGLGAFSCRRDAWPGFNPRFRGFGGEEGYLHEKFRRGGARTLCLPWLRWSHRFGRPRGVTYRNTHEDRLRNYLVGHAELGLDPVPIVQHFAELLPEEVLQRVLTEAYWPPPEETLETAYQRAAETPSDINEHVPTLRALGARCEHVTELGTRRGVSTTALASGRPATLVTYDLVRDPAVDALVPLARAEGVDLLPVTADVLHIDVEATDLLFIDTFHTAAQLEAELSRHAGRARRWIALHDTQTFGEVGEDGGPGLLHALNRFLPRHREWTVAYSSRANNGLTVLSRDPADVLPLPPGAPVHEPLHLEGEVAAVTAEQDRHQPFLVALCPTYKRRSLLENAIACFLAQTYPPSRRRLLVLDDFGDLGSAEQDGYAVVSRSERFPTLAAKYAELARLALERWPGLDGFVIWEDDDVYLPDHLAVHGRALRGAAWSKPGRVLSTHEGLHTEAADGRFFASLAVRRDVFETVGGFVQTGRADFDQHFLARLRAAAGDAADPSAAAPPTYVFRWSGTGSAHAQSFMSSPADETWYAAAGNSLPDPGTTHRPLVPQLDVESAELLRSRASNPVQRGS